MLPMQAAGDVNGDGRPDFLLGDPDHDSGTGIAYLIPGDGARLRGELRASQISTAYRGGRLPGGGVESAGRSLGGGRDVNGDGYDDFLIGAPDNGIGDVLGGNVYLILGGRTRSR
jgi:hypothetical protein